MNPLLTATSSNQYTKNYDYSFLFLFSLTIKVKAKKYTEKYQTVKVPYQKVVITNMITTTIGPASL